MITQYFLEAVSAFVSGLLDLLPSWGSFPSGAQAVGAAVGGAARAFNAWLPLVTIFQGIAALVGVRIAAAVWNMLVWIYHQVPVFGGSD